MDKFVEVVGDAMTGLMLITVWGGVALGVFAVVRWAWLHI